MLQSDHCSTADCQWFAVVMLRLQRELFDVYFAKEEKPENVCHHRNHDHFDFWFYFLIGNWFQIANGRALFFRCVKRK